MSECQSLLIYLDSSQSFVGRLTFTWCQMGLFAANWFRKYIYCGSSCRFSETLFPLVP